jgi:uncharacterized protein (DUF58 family)
MRRRERAFALVLGTICALSLLAGAWPLPLIAFALLELSYSVVERAAERRACRATRTVISRTGGKRLEVSFPVAHEHVAPG